jgi:hypothetical protein
LVEEYSSEKPKFEMKNKLCETILEEEDGSPLDRKIKNLSLDLEEDI